MTRESGDGHFDGSEGIGETRTRENNGVAHVSKVQDVRV